MEDIRRSGFEMPASPKLKKPTLATTCSPSSAAVSSSIIPLAPEGWQKPLVSQDGASTSGTKQCLVPIDIIRFSQGLGPKDGEKKQIPILSQPSEIRFRSARRFASIARNAACFKLEQAIEHELKYGRKLDPNMDPKKLRRTISNRLSAQRSRMKKAQYMNEMEKKVKDLEATIAVMAPQIQYHQHQKKMLTMENDLLQKTLENCTEKSSLRAFQIEEKKAEVERLKELHRILLEERERWELTQQQQEQEEETSGIDDMNPDQFLNLSAVNLDNDANSV